MRKQFTTFKLDEQLFGVEVLLVREINQQMDITPVQQAPEHIRGLINLRGQIITVFDLGVRLGLDPREISGTSHSVILKTEEELGPLHSREGREDLKSSADAVGLLVDTIGDVVEEDETEIEPPPANLGSVDGRFLSGVVKLHRDLLVLLDVTKILGVDE